jgi:O-antigen/teichoic acid export membrane protein
MSLKRFLCNGSNKNRDSYVWNMIGSILMAFQSVILLMVLRRTMDLAVAGVFSIAYANSNLFLTVGKFGMRNFQVSDIEQQFTFSEYKCSRWISTIAMMVIVCIYVFVVSFKNGYTFEKAMIIIWMCLYKAVDSIEDVYCGEYQRRDRLDIGAKSLTLRVFVTMIIFVIAVVITRSLLISLIVSTLATALIAIVLIKMTVGEFCENYVTLLNKKRVLKLLWLCLPLFLGAFLSFYIGNAPKYSIDAILSDEIQACYGFIAMPVFVIGLLNNFIFNPLIFRLSSLWNENKIESFIKRIFIQSIVVCIITLVCIGAASICGIPVLSWLYNTDLSAYKQELLIMLLGGGFLGMSGLLNIVITIMRGQRLLMTGYIVTALMAILFSDMVVERDGVMGATVFYTILMCVLSIAFFAIFIYGIVKKKKEI